MEEQPVRNMSFSLTTEQVVDRRKWVTRRVGWWSLLVDTELWAVEKAMGLRKGQQVRKLALIRVVDVRVERLDELVRPGPYGATEMILEGFPGMDPQDFLNLSSFENHDPSVIVNRIQFEYLDQCRWRLDEELRPWLTDAVHPRRV